VASTFGAVPLDQVIARSQDAGALPWWSAPDNVAVHMVPNGEQVTQLLGVGAERVTFVLDLTSAHYDSLAALRQTVATLTIVDVSYGSCTLVGLANEVKRYDGGIRVEATWEKVTA
jgi:hypothetical protein